MHACGHDAHIAILMGVAEVLAGMRAQMPGTVKFIFQPAEEGPPEGEEGGASLMIKEGALENPTARRGVRPARLTPYRWGRSTTGRAAQWRPATGFNIVVHGKQTHGAQPWRGVDPIVIASQIVLGLQTIASRQVDVSKAAAVITVGTINGGVRDNIIPDSVVMTGTIRTLRRGHAQGHQRSASSARQRGSPRPPARRPT